jgi:hypothetical protein
MNDTRNTAWIDALLTDTARETHWPATPDARARVLARLAQPQRINAVPLPRLLAIALAAFALLVAALLANPGTRTALAEFFGLVEGYRIEVVPTVAPAALRDPTLAESATPTATPLDGIATRSTLAAAFAAAGLAPALPADAGTPDVYLARFGAQTTVLLRYPRFDLWQGRNGVPGLQVKSAPEGTLIETPQVRGRAGYWVAGTERTLRFVDADGRDIPGSTRTVGRNALVWTGENRLYRLETDLPLADALRIANQLP